MEKDKSKNEQQQPSPVKQPVKQEETKQRSSAFNEPAPGNEKSTSNAEEADLEQERKDAMTERD